MLATVIATGVAWFQATKSRNAARDAEEALAEVLRPEFVPRVRPNGKAGFHVELDNAARHDALDVEFEVRHPDSQKLAGGSVHRASGQVLNTWAGDPAINATILGLPVLEEVGASFDLVIVLWFSDERGRHRWRQELRTT